MYDTCLFANEPCGAIGSRSIIDMGNVPIILSPNEYRDGALESNALTSRRNLAMGVGPSTKETTLHHFRDPLIDVVANMMKM